MILKYKYNGTTNANFTNGDIYVATPYNYYTSGTGVVILIVSKIGSLVDISQSDLNTIAKWELASVETLGTDTLYP